MLCSRLAELLPAYLDGSLTGRLNQRVAEHLDACERCQFEMSAQQRALRALDAGRHAVNIDLWADFSRRLQEQAPAPVAPWRRASQPVMAFAAAVAAVFLIAHLAASPTPVLSTAPMAGAPLRIASSESSLQPDGSAHLHPRESAVSPPGFHARRSPVQAARLSLGPVNAARHRGDGFRLRHHRETERVSHAKAAAAASPTSQRRSEAHSYEVAFLPVSALSEPVGQSLAGATSSAAADPMGISPAPNAPMTSTQPSTRTELTSARSGDPVRVAMALAAVEKDTASTQMDGELLRMAREVARVSGEAGSAEIEPPASGADVTADGPADSSHSSGT
jgi:hypothetical protein